MRKTMRRAVRRQQLKALAKLDEAMEKTFIVGEDGKAKMLGDGGPVAVALGECNLSRAEVDKDVRRSLARWGIG